MSALLLLSLFLLDRMAAPVDHVVKKMEPVLVQPVRWCLAGPTASCRGERLSLPSLARKFTLAVCLQVGSRLIFRIAFFTSSLRSSTKLRTSTITTRTEILNARCLDRQREDLTIMRNRDCLQSQASDQTYAGYSECTKLPMHILIFMARPKSILHYFPRMNLSNNPRPVNRGPPGEIGIRWSNMMVSSVTPSNSGGKSMSNKRCSVARAASWSSLAVSISSVLSWAKRTFARWNCVRLKASSGHDVSVRRWSRIFSNQFL